MHVVKVAFECAAFDVALMRGGTATLVWNLATQFVAAGNRVSIVTPAHGRVDYLKEHHGVQEVGEPDEHTVPLVLDRRIWPDHPAEVPLSLTTRAYRLSRDGVDIYFLSDEFLDLLPDRFYPANEFQGHDLAFFKPFVFQVDAIRFVDRFFSDPPTVVHGYEPYHHYLVTAVLGVRPGWTTASTIAVNAAINGKVYRPALERILEEFSTTVDLDRFADPPLDGPLATAMANYLRPSYRQHAYGPDYTCYYSLVAAHADVIDFLSPGQQRYYSTFRDTPSELMFQRLTVSSVVKETAHKQLVGGCALPDWWLDRDPGRVDRNRVLSELGLDPARPTFYHAARLDRNHKGQFELFRAAELVLQADPDVNFVIRCAVGAGGSTPPPAGDPYFQAVADRYPDNIYLDWRMVDEEVLFDQAASADFCLFPSKFELDAFLITLGEAMACGAVPIATAQETLSHYRLTRPLTDPSATGFAVPRSFRTTDTRLVDHLVDAIRAALHTFRHDPPTWQRLARNSRALARTFTWRACAQRRLERFARVAGGHTEEYPVELAIECGWFDRLDDDAWVTHRDRIARAAMARGDIDAYRRCAPVDTTVAARLFASAYARADFDRCQRLAELAGERERRLLRDRCRTDAGGFGRRVEYHLPHAERVDLIVPYRSLPDTGSGNRYTHALTRHGNRFVGDLPDGLDDRSLVFMLTLDTGRTAWDVIVDHREGTQRHRRVDPLAATGH